MFFTQEAWDSFQLSDEENKLLKAITEAEKKDKDEGTEDEKNKGKKTEEEDSTKVKPLTFDWENLDERSERLTIHSSRLGDAVLSKDGETLYYLARFEDKLNLWSTKLRTKETKQEMKLGASSGSLEWDRDMKNLYLLSGGKISKLDLDKSEQKAVKLRGEMAYDERAERAAIFDHVWLRTKAVFYRSDFHGIDWDSMRVEYEKYLPSIGNSFELTELLSEMLGELNVSHAGARYRPTGFENPDKTASLGILMDYDYAGDGIRIAEILPGGPLDKAELRHYRRYGHRGDQRRHHFRGARRGQLPQPHGGPVHAPATARPTDRLDQNDHRQTDLVSPTRAELLYTRWVKQNQAEVDSLSGGQLGYVHIPGMSDGPYRDIYQDMLGRYYDRKGMIIDTRFNGGGDLVADLAMFFTGVPFISYATEAKVVGGEPTSRWTKPTLALINEAQYSDGHCFAQGYTDLKIGKTVGMPTPGTCSFAGWERLPDGSVWGVVPVSAKDIDGEWMENNQTEPLVKVKNMPGVIATGRDQQLGAGYRTAAGGGTVASRCVNSTAFCVKVRFCAWCATGSACKFIAATYLTPAEEPEKPKNE